MTEMTVLVAARWRAAFDGPMTPQQRRSEAVARLSEHDGEKVVDGQAVLDLQRAGQDDGRITAEVGREGRCLGVSWQGLGQH